MNNYKYLAWSGTATLIVLTIFLGISAKQVKDTAITTNTVSFSGEGKVLAKPDIAAISFSIVTEAKTSKEAQNQNSEKSKKVFDFLKSQEIDEKDTKTTGYNVYPQYNYSKPCPLGVPENSYYPCVGEQKISGYQVNQLFEVKVRDLGKVSTILDGLVTAGANQVNSLGFKVDNEEKLKEEAREMAIKDAKRKAEQLEGELGINLGKIVNYNEGGYYPVYFKAEVARDQAGGYGEGGPSIPVGENEIIVNVTITYQIK